MPVPENYADWRYCITQLCRIGLTPAFIDERLAALRDRSDHGTKRFVATWGEAHLSRTIGWFEQAKAELGAREHQSG